jgi:hypothetical protein
VLAHDLDVESVERREPKKEEIKDPSVWVLDIGRIYDAKIRAFDHHQKEWQECTVSLVLKSWNLWEKATYTFPWLEYIVIDDALGPNKVSEMLGISIDTFLALDSPIENALIDIFQNINMLHKGDPLFIILQDVGKTLLSEIERFSAILSEIEKKAVIKEIKGVSVIFAEFIEPSNTLKNVIMRFKKQKWGFGGISVTQSGRELNSLALRRLENDSRVDFRRIKILKEKVTFIHADGFMATISNPKQEEIEEIIKQSIN